MAEGERDAFIENDVIGNYALGTNFIGRMASRRRKKKTRKSRRKVKHSRKRKHSRRSSVHKRSRGGVKYTKNGQPYKIMPNGRARFLKKK